MDSQDKAITEEDYEVDVITSEGHEEELEQSETEQVPGTAKLSFAHIARALKKAVADGNVTAQQASNMRREMGIGSGYFTSKKVNPNKRKRKNKAAKKARKANRGK